MLTIVTGKHREHVCGESPMFTRIISFSWWILALIIGLSLSTPSWPYLEVEINYGFKILLLCFLVMMVREKSLRREAYQFIILLSWFYIISLIYFRRPHSLMRNEQASAPLRGSERSERAASFPSVTHVMDILYVRNLLSNTWNEENVHWEPLAGSYLCFHYLYLATYFFCRCYIFHFLLGHMSTGVARTGKAKVSSGASPTTPQHSERVTWEGEDRKCSGWTGL